MATPNAVYDVTLRLNDPQAKTAGFLAEFFRPGAVAGIVIAPGDDVETRAAAVRSTAPRSAPAVWRFRWRAPNAQGRILLRAAANASNDDASAFGDVIHYAERHILVAPPGR